MESKACACGHQLPLTQPHNQEALVDVDEASIRTMVDAFYVRVRADGLLGPIFNSLITDWDEHMPKMYDFWSSAVLRTGRYSGRPLEVHMGLPGAGPDHYRRWIDLWREVVSEHMPEEAASVFVGLAMRMGRLMAAQYEN
jgi:hemoglobin